MSNETNHSTFITATPIITFAFSGVQKLTLMKRPSKQLISFFLFLVIFGIVASLIENKVYVRTQPQWGSATLLLEKGWNHQKENYVIEDAKNGNPIKIMIWTAPKITGGRMNRLKAIKKAMSQQSCFKDCRLTVGRNQLEVDEADAVVFFMFNVGFTRKELPVTRRREQIWVYNQHEPPPYYSPGKDLNGLFNWTMTYRHDSDIYQPPFLKLSRSNHSNSIYIGDDNIPIHEWIEEKTALATAAISVCNPPSKREAILKKLQSSGIPIHIYGGCGNKTVCHRYGGSCSGFWKGLAAQYKFYLAFENSLCSDYITEKFWRALQLGMVPIVLGRGEYAEVAPPNSYIDIRHFSGPLELKEFLQRLDIDKGELAKYFEWMKDYYINLNTDNFCKLCEKLKERKSHLLMNASQTGRVSPKVWNNLAEWWKTDPGRPNRPVCISPKQVGRGKFLELQNNQNQ